MLVHVSVCTSVNGTDTATWGYTEKETVTQFEHGSVAEMKEC